MFNKNSLSIPTALVFFALLGVSAAQAKDEDTPCYTVASVQGSWAVIGTFGANVALSLGVRSVDKNGVFAGTAVINAPTLGSPTGARTIGTVTQNGSFAVNCDGTGTITRVLNGTTTQIDDIVITKGIVKDGRRIATAIQDAQRVPSALVPGGIFVIRVHTRLPSDEDRERER
jgi:hypothetical protein